MADNSNEPLDKRVLAAAYAVGNSKANLSSAIRRLNLCRIAAVEAGYVVPEQLEFVDNQLCGQAATRSGWRRMSARLKKGDIAAIFIYEPSMGYCRQRCLYRFFARSGIQIHLVHPGTDPFSRFLRDLRL